jgi:tRNA threonylcarbamoyladenosine biosynthesis protein TsaE
MPTIVSRNAEQTIELGKKIAEKLTKGSVVALHGPLGSGKTTLVKGIAAGLGIEESVTSPSFTLISEYEGRLRLYHMDLYRIDSIDEFELLGAEELMYDEGVTIIEWAEKIEEILPENRIGVTFDMEAGGVRKISITGADI